MKVDVGPTAYSYGTSVYIVAKDVTGDGTDGFTAVKAGLNLCRAQSLWAYKTANSQLK
jgi:hypothetical protein